MEAVSQHTKIQLIKFGPPSVAWRASPVLGDNFLHLHRIGLNGKLVLISMLGNGDLVIYDAASRKEFKRVQIGHGAAGILMDQDGGRAFIACGPDNYVAVLDLKSLEVTSHIDVGGEPDGLAWAIRP